METCIRKYSDIDIKDLKEVGYKNASFGKMMKLLLSDGVLTPGGFAITVGAYRYFLSYNHMDKPLKQLMSMLDKKSLSNLTELSEKARTIIMNGKMPADLGMQIIDAYDYLIDMTSAPVAIRSSVVSDHVVDAAAGGFNDSYLNVQGHCALLYAIRQCFASTYNDKAVRHAAEKGYDPSAMAMSVGVQEMIRSDKGASGIGYTDPLHSGSISSICLKAIWGLGELVHHENIEPDLYIISNPSSKLTTSLIDRTLGSKSKMMIYAADDDETNQTILIDTPVNLQQRFVLDDEEILRLADWAIVLDKQYRQPICFEWAKDGNNHQLYLLQVCPLSNCKQDTTTK